MITLGISWETPIKFEQLAGRKHGFIAKNIKLLPVEAGVYVITKMKDGKFIPIYVGRTNNIRGRLNSYLKQDNEILKYARENRDFEYFYIGGKVNVDNTPIDRNSKDFYLLLDSIEAYLTFSICKDYELINRHNNYGTNRIFNLNRTEDAWLNWLPTSP